ncbi:hypothetical protein BDK51DRAFT_46259 [Blyttiomyces helicus]|uniref:Radical SAM core domain-containing protein n=1 Tax=Blyttiomyces helicus TaxID=388810 RepID=A0A4P9VVF2_9FUNG|nr:hypothetical protein BDK51DRAFT_46259 [Blyttiomyces helicus]|eukprot:RKO82795.1 hypothetical protein BDK51DRAFT_46259 [Blyttiomyces helicus]
MHILQVRFTSPHSSCHSHTPRQTLTPSPAPPPSFNKYRIPAGGQPHDRMTRALTAELTHALTLPVEAAGGGEWTGTRTRERLRVHSVYFGGGTPSLARPETVAAVLETIARCADVGEGIEVSLEGNPTSTETAHLQSFRDVGVNRLSLGIQALTDRDLRFLGRDHSVSDALASAQAAMSVFDRVSLDFIWGRPGQSVRDWEEELTRACTLGASHLSLYQLTVERGTPLFRAVEKAATVMPDSDTLADMFERTSQIASQCGYEQYEVCSFAKNGDARNRSSHNSSYWLGLDYIGKAVGQGLV